MKRPSHLAMDRLRVLGDPVLRQESRPVSDFDDDLRQLVDLMFRIMDRENGIGLAAPQIGIQRKVIVWRHPESDERNVLLNPRIVERSAEESTEAEGCLSVPGHSMQVARAEKVVVEARGLDGQAVTLEATGLLARVIQHEIDHIEGRLILDRVSQEERRRVLRELRERPLES